MFTTNFLRQSVVGTSFSSEDDFVSSDLADGDFLGSPLAIDGDYAIVGAPAKSGGGSFRGAAYIFVRSGSTWTQQQKLTPSDTLADNDSYGVSVSINGDTCIVGASGRDSYGAAYVFTRSGSTWTQQQKLTPTGYDSGSSASFGCSVSVTGDDAAVGAYSDGSNTYPSQYGSVYVFTRSGSTWTQQQRVNALVIPSTTNFFGINVRIYNDTFLASSSDHDSLCLFTRSGSTWSRQYSLSSSGNSLDFDGTHLIVGYPYSSSNKGRAIVYKVNPTTLSQIAIITASDGAAGDYFGWDVAVDGNRYVVGANREDGAGTQRGAIYTFMQSGADVIQLDKLTASDTEDNDRFGDAVAISGNTIIASAPAEDGAGTDRGKIYSFTS